MTNTVPWNQANLQDDAWLQGEPNELAQYIQEKGRAAV